MLSSRVSVPPSTETPEVEDIFSSSLTTLFTDDTQISHGTPGQLVIYHSPRFGEITLKIPTHPDVEEGRKLFAHYLWNAGIVAAEAIEQASLGSEAAQNTTNDKHGKAVFWDSSWNVRGQNVLELGAGTALPSLIAALSSAASVTITDHPSSPAIVTDTIATNVSANLFVSPHSSSNPRPHRQVSAHVSIHGYTWGTTSFHSSTSYGRLSSPQPQQRFFDRIIIADCLWMPSQHVKLVQTILAYLAERSSSSSSSTSEADESCALIVAGFHTGRSIVSNFFRIATGSRGAAVESFDEIKNEDGDENDQDDEEILSVKGSLRAASIFEVDVDANMRPWRAVRPGENRDQAKRWCVCAVLVRR